MSAPLTAEAVTPAVRRRTRLGSALGWVLAGMVAVVAFAALALAALAAALMGLLGAVASAVLPAPAKGARRAGAPEGWVAEAFARR